MWLNDDEYADRWYGNEEPNSAKERRIITMHWAGGGYKGLCGNQYDGFRGLKQVLEVDFMENFSPF